jgi:predicted nucleic acid-binding Zn ribbon protein
VTMAEKLLQHRHCKNCHKAILPDLKFCDGDCESQHREMMRKKRNQLLLLMAFAIILMLMTVIPILFSP